MKNLSKLLFALSLVWLGGCAVQPVAYSKLQSTPQLQKSQRDDADTVPYLYAPQVDWKNYSSIQFEPVIIYNGEDNQFDDLSPEQKNELARYAELEFSKQLATRYTISTASGPQALRLVVTLTGAKKNNALVTPVTRIDLMGGPVNIVQGIRGKEGVFMGSVSYSVEVYAADSNRLLKAYITKQYPNPMNFGAAFGALSAAKTGLDKGALDLLAQLQSR